LVIFGTLLQSLSLVHQFHFGTPVIGSVFNTFGIIPSEFWYIWLTLAHFTSGTPVGTLSLLVVVLLVHQADFWHTRMVFGHFGYLVQSVCLVHQLRLVYCG